MMCHGIGKDSTGRLLSEATRLHCPYGGFIDFSVTRHRGYGGLKTLLSANPAFSKRGGAPHFRFGGWLGVCFRD